MEVRKCFEDIFRETNGKTPLKMQADSGTEFASHVRSLFKERKIHFYVTRNPYFHCAHIERYNRTLKAKMYKYFTYANSYRYIDVLNSLVESYNKAKHSVTGLPPSHVNETNQLQVFRRLYGGEGRYKKLGFRPEIKIQFGVGDFVRIAREKSRFEKGYVNNWSQEIFEITSIKGRARPMFEISDLATEKVVGLFYAEELQKVKIDKNTQFKIEKIIETKGRGKNKKYLIKWLHYSDKFNSWVSAKDLTTI